MVDIILLALFIGGIIWGFKSHNPHYTPYLTSLIVGILLGLALHKVIATHINAHTGLNYPFVSVASFAVLIMVGAIIFYALTLLYYHLRPKEALELYANFSKANFVSLPIIIGLAACLIFTLFAELPIRGNILLSAQSTVANSEVVKLSLKAIQGVGIDPAVLKTVHLSQQETSETVIPLNFKSQKITYDQSLEAAMTKLINRERTNNGVEPLDYSSELADVGREHSIDMLQRQYFAHINLSGKSPFDRLHSSGISYSLAGENLAVSDKLDKAVTALMLSPTHRANILNDKFHKTGIGIAVNQDGVMAISEEFTN